MKKIIIQLFRFGVTGGMVTILDFGLVFIFYSIFHINVLVATFMAYVIATLFNYILSVTWVFNAQKNHKRNLPVFFILSLIGLGITEGVMFIGTSILGIQYIIAKAIATIFVNVFNFISRKIVLECRT